MLLRCDESLNGRYSMAASSSSRGLLPNPIHDGQFFEWGLYIDDTLPQIDLVLKC